MPSIPCASQCSKVSPRPRRSSPEVDSACRQDNATPSLHLHYGGFFATTGGSAPRSSIGVLPHGVGHLSFPLASGTRFSRSVPKPVLRSCRLYTGCHRVRKQVTPRFILKPMVHLSFDSALGITMRRRTVCFRSSSQYSPANPDGMTFPQSLTTAPFERSSTGWFEACSCKPASGGLLPSSVQHHRLSLVFVTHSHPFASSFQLAACDG